MFMGYPLEVLTVFAFLFNVDDQVGIGVYNTGAMQPLHLHPVHLSA